MDAQQVAAEKAATHFVAMCVNGERARIAERVFWHLVEHTMFTAGDGPGEYAAYYNKIIPEAFAVADAFIAKAAGERSA